MAFSLSLCMDGVFFNLEPSSDSSDGDVPIVSIRRKRSAVNDDGESEISDVVADLSNFNGLLHISSQPFPRKRDEERVKKKCVSETSDEEDSMSEISPNSSQDSQSSSQEADNPPKTLGERSFTDELKAVFKKKDIGTEKYHIEEDFSDIGSCDSELKKQLDKLLHENSVDSDNSILATDEKVAIKQEKASHNSRPPPIFPRKAEPNTKNKKEIPAKRKKNKNESEPKMDGGSQFSSKHDTDIESGLGARSFSSDKIDEIKANLRSLESRAIATPSTSTTRRVTWASPSIKEANESHVRSSITSKQSDSNQRMHSATQMRSNMNRIPTVSTSEEEDESMMGTPVFSDSRVGGLTSNISDHITDMHNIIFHQNNSSDEDADSAELELTNGSISVVTTRFHEACIEPNVSIAHLRGMLKSCKADAQKRDRLGRLPIHLFARNKALALSHTREECQLFLEDLLRIYPGSLTVKDKHGETPFISSVTAWVEAVHQDVPFLANESTTTNKEEINVAAIERWSLTLLPVDVLTMPFIEWSIQMLSYSIDLLNPSKFMVSTDADLARTCRGIVIKRFSSIPLLAQTVLLMEDEFEMTRILNTSIFRAAMTNKQIVGPWLLSMIQGNSIVSSRAISFLEFLSNSSPRDAIGCNRLCSEDELMLFQKKRQETFRAVGKLQGILHCIQQLDPPALERFATTQVIQCVIDQSIQQPLVVGLLAFDILLHIIVMLVYRLHIETFSIHESIEDSLQGDNGSPLLLILIAGAYFLPRDILTAMSKKNSSGTRDVGIGGLIDIASTTSILFTCIWLGFNSNSSTLPIPNIVALTVALSWIKLLGLFTSLNLHLSTLVGTIMEVIKDIRWFLLVLAISIFTFADTIGIVTRATGLCSNDGDDIEYFCPSNTLEGYAKIYGALIGDVSIEEFQSAPGITILFVLFTIFGILVLLNTLIAIVDDSYTKSKLRSISSFGRARLAFIETHRARAAFFDLREQDMSTERAMEMTGNHSTCMSRSKIVLMRKQAFMLMMIGLTAAVEYMLFRTVDIHQSSESLRVVHVVCLLIVAPMLCGAVILMFFALQYRARFGSLDNITIGFNWLTRFFSTVLGISCSTDRGYGADGMKGGLWQGKLKYLEDNTNRIVEESEGRIISELRYELKATEHRLSSQDQLTRKHLRKAIEAQLHDI